MSNPQESKSVRDRLAAMLLWVALAGFVPTLRADNQSRWAAEGQAAVESWLRSDTNDWFRAEFGDFVRIEGSGLSQPVWNIQGYDYLTLNRTAHFTRGTIPMTIYVTEGAATAPGLTNVGMPVLEGQVSSIQGARIFVSHPELYLGLFKRHVTKVEIEAAQNNKTMQEQRLAEDTKRDQFEKARQRWGDEGLAAVEAYLRSGTNAINALCGDFVCFQNEGYPQYSFDTGSDFGRGHKPSMRITVRALFSRGYIPLTLIITEGRVTAPGLTNVGTPVIDGAVESHLGTRILVSHTQLCLEADYPAQDALKFLTAEAEARLVGEYQLDASAAERAAEPKDQTCTLQLRADHTLVISNCPAPGDAQRFITIPGNWSLSAYRNLNLVRFRMSVNGGNEVKLRGATCDLVYPNNFNPHQSFRPGLDVICRDESGKQQKLWFRAVKGILPSGTHSNPHFVTRPITNRPPNWDTPVYDNPETKMREVIACQRKLNNTNNGTVGLFQVRLAEMIRKNGRLDEAETNLLQGLAVLVATSPLQSGDVADALMIHARILMDKHDLAGAEKAAREAVEKFPPQHYRLREACQLLNQVLTAEGKPLVPLPTIAIATNAVAPPETNVLDPNSVANLQFEVDKRRRLFGNESTNLADTLGLLSSVLRDEGKLIEAEAARRENLAIRRKVFGDSHPQVATSYEALGTILQREGKLADAETAIREALAIREKVYGADGMQVQKTRAHLNEVLKLEGKPVE
jgi:tetratricopeptide (TPR) repeat protein